MTSRRLADFDLATAADRLRGSKLCQESTIRYAAMGLRPIGPEIAAGPDGNFVWPRFLQNSFVSRSLIAFSQTSHIPLRKMVQYSHAGNRPWSMKAVQLSMGIRFLKSADGFVMGV
jgi:hypothetical protein